MARRKQSTPQLLPDAMVDQIRTTMRALHDMLPLCEKCESCGICMDDHKRAITDLIEQFTALLKHFGPTS